jgi:adenine-specific DNA-methyltransferase
METAVKVKLLLSPRQSRGITFLFRPLFEVEDRSATVGLYQWIVINSAMRGLSATEKSGAAAPPDGARLYQPTSLTSQGASAETVTVEFEGKKYTISFNQHWKTRPEGI